MKVGLLIIETCKNEQSAYKKEKYWINRIGLENLTNVVAGGRAPKMTKEIKNRISKTLMGHSVSSESRLKISKKNKGRKLTIEHRKKLSKSLKGRKHTLTVEQRRKIGERNKCRIYTKEMRKRMSESQLNSKNHKGMLGKYHTEETKRKIAATLRNYVQTEEQKRKNSIAVTLWWKKRKAALNVPSV